MNLAEPSGSSPDEKPPASAKIWQPLISRAITSIERAMSSAVRLQNTDVRTSAPAVRNALAMS